MKADTHSLQPAHDAHPADGHGEHHAGGSRESYLIGFGLSVILTAIPFWLVMSGVLGDKQLTGLAITALAAIQIVVHMVYFLHMNTRSEGGWTMMALIFTIIMVVIGLTGTLWVMHHLNVNMMPGHDMSTMQ
ncbi:MULTISPECIES: cytochrome o ubiquinol oxidase subunit IV [Bradyrhizobium]|uniref:cytochrome o ubiquinol oxidase subunit IV n=1 Tax=Bradyrhizobium TaxID=374 RepID=UPI0010293AED|nr:MULTISPECIES: cytochrome o ubiquinol oxidase subunit IV [Bradyrhizobium]MBO4225568.1 cytochrome o ubiquinol oxidase subunit IV [Bradyrhizobium neotropicale]RZN32243.1 cytochrome o ubiquinol oxidase subunit IV [Bradyrhizobium sp. Leo121]